jgi:hypothetical protein
MQNTYQTYKKIRKVWSINPRTRCKGNDKVYSRKQAKEITAKLIKEGYKAE